MTARAEGRAPTAPAPRAGGVLRLVLAAVRMCWLAGRRDLVRLIALQAIAALTIGAQLLLVKALVAELEHGAAHTAPLAQRTAPVLAGLVLLAGVSSVARAIAFGSREVLAERVSRSVTLRVIQLSSDAPLLAFDDPRHLDVLTRARVDGGVRALQVVNGLSAASTGLFTAGAITATLLSLAPLVVPVLALVVVPLMRVAASNSIAYLRFVRGATTTERRREYFADLLTQRASGAEIRVLNLGRYLTQRYAEAAAEVLRALRANVSERTKRTILGEVVAMAALLIALVLVLVLFAQSRLSLPAALTVLFAMTQLRGTLTEVTFQIAELQEAAYFLGDFDQLEAEQERRERLSGPTVPAGRLSELQVVDVTFRYGAGPRVLDGATLDLRRGEVLGLVGANGSGKTTLARIVAGLLEPESGVVLWNGKPRGELDLRHQVIVLPQDFGRYWLTARENVTLGLKRSDDEVQAALRTSKIMGALAAFDDGLDTMLAPELGGADLSIGQWQRLALARTLLRDASLVILDEPTAALDPPSERRLYEDVRLLFADRAVLLISHRLTGVQHADRIAVMVDGAIREVGAHDELLDRRGAYAELWGVGDAELQPASAGAAPGPVARRGG